MAKKEQKEKSIEETLWDSANKLRGSVEPSEYKHVVLSLIFLKYAYDRFLERRNELIANNKDAFIDQPVFYNAKNVFYLNEISRWDYLMENAKQNDIAIKIDTALAQVEKDNPSLKGALPSNYYSGLGLDRTKLASLLDVIGKIDTQKDKEHDLIGRVYEYFLGKFAIAEGKGKGEYYTPKTIVNLIAEMIRHFRLWTGIYQHHLQVGKDESCHPGHCLQLGRTRSRYVPRRPAQGLESRFHHGQSAFQPEVVACGE